MRKATSEGVIASTEADLAKYDTFYLGRLPTEEPEVPVIDAVEPDKVSGTPPHNNPRASRATRVFDTLCKFDLCNHTGLPFPTLRASDSCCRSQNC